MGKQDILGNWLTQNICWLKIGLDRKDLDESLTDMLSEMMIGAIDMLRPLTLLWNSDHFKGTAVILEKLAVDVRLCANDWKAQCTKFINKLHQWNHIPQAGAQRDVFSFGGR